ncbi:MAG TPA: hypothetical protein VK897_15905, partial [Anaerolineales bacterium]|nr:hypothetical protein [Anaerolineales bacterium]
MKIVIFTAYFFYIELRDHFAIHHGDGHGEGQSFRTAIHCNGIAFLELAGQQPEGQRVLQLALDGALER